MIVGLEAHRIPDSQFSALSTLSHCCPFGLPETSARLRPCHSPSGLLTRDSCSSTAGGIEVAGLHLGFVLDLYRDDPVSNDCLKADHRGVLIQWVHKETCRSRAQHHGVPWPHSARPFPGKGPKTLVCQMEGWYSLPLRGCRRGLRLGPHGFEARHSVCSGLLEKGQLSPVPDNSHSAGMQGQCGQGC